MKIVTHAAPTRAWYLSRKKFAAAVASRQYKEFLERCTRARCTVLALRIWGVTMMPSGRVLFVYATARTSNRPDFNEDMVLRGSTACVFVDIQAPSGRYVAFVEQARASTGGRVLELPAGVREEVTFQGTALKEMQQELGIHLTPSQLRPLGEPVWTSQGILDERIMYYHADVEMSDEQVDALNYKHRGVAAEHESLTVRILKWEEAKRFGRTDGKYLAAMALLKESLED